MPEFNLTWHRYPVRSLYWAGIVYFVGGDICRAVEIVRPNDALARLPEQHKTTVAKLSQGTVTDRVLSPICSGMPLTQIVVTEGGVYRLLLTSRHPAAAPFSDWVCDDVLPTIRQFGCYPKPKRAISVHMAGHICGLIQKEEIDYMRNNKEKWDETKFNDRVAERINREHPECRHALAWYFSHRHKHVWDRASRDESAPRPRDETQLELFARGYETVLRDGHKDKPVVRYQLSREEILYQIAPRYNSLVRSARRMEASSREKLLRIFEVYAEFHPENPISLAEKRAAAPEVFNV